MPPLLSHLRRTSAFEVRGGLTEDNAPFEAPRCPSCGTCFECDSCHDACPHNTVIKLGSGNRYRINLDFCKGCGLCAKECPCGALDVMPEETRHAMRPPPIPDPPEIDPEPRPLKERKMPAAIALFFLILASLGVVAIKRSLVTPSPTLRERLRILRSADAVQVPAGCAVP